MEILTSGPQADEQSEGAGAPISNWQSHRANTIK
ncbi:hypothetical protein Hbal_0911 [Hirschia baltica ATCC 49814]|uniref:Uncharacterized protein n=1 Tax=Hirschia baltica (strain ATCC 49814 / DSM 5838 / IFAM 1418) TaxID=582402 RepID=C6XQJ9_HIRBI|nr:hypothetical protein Hbal_0911 [Hirschia baltica ATCC 49814]